MSCTNTQDFCVGAGETFRPVLRWGTSKLASKPITAITQAAPVAITAAGHGVPDGWQVAVVSAGGMSQINATKYPPIGSDLHSATVIDANTIQLNDVSSAAFTAYTSGGFLVYTTPTILTGMTAVMTIRDAPLNGNVLTTLTSTTGITIDTVGMTINPVLSTTGLTWTSGFYDLAMTDSLGDVTQLLIGTITIG